MNGKEQAGISENALYGNEAKDGEREVRKNCPQKPSEEAPNRSSDQAADRVKSKVDVARSLRHREGWRKKLKDVVKMFCGGTEPGISAIAGSLA